jgi:spermidine/putrescine-binding protein
VAALALLSGCKKAPPTLSLLVWEGYADPSFIQGFEAKCQCKVTAAYMGSSDELVAKLRGGAASNYDVISPSSDVATMLSRSGLVAPLDLSKIPNYAQLSPTLTSKPLVKAKRQGLRSASHLGPQSPALRHHRLCQSARHLG